MSLFGHYFSVLKLGRQLDHVVFQPKAGREESSIMSGSGLGSLPRNHCRGSSPGQSLWLFQGLQDPGLGEHMGLCQGSCPLSPCHSSLPWQHKTFLQPLLFVVRQENPYWHIPVVLVSHLKLSANSPVTAAPQIPSNPNRQLQKEYA